MNPNDPVVKNRSLETWGRALIVPESTSKVAKFHFMDLCGKPYSAADYLEITRKFGVVFLLDVPKMGLDQKDLVRIHPVESCCETILMCGLKGATVYHVHRCMLRKQGK